MKDDLLNSLEEIGLNKSQASSAVFRVIDHLIAMEPTDEIWDSGLHHNHRSNSHDNMLKSYRAMLWASFEELDND